MTSTRKRFLRFVSFLSIVICLAISFKTQQTKLILQAALAKLSRYFNKSQCLRPQTQIAFVKVHKTASTTVTSLLQRFGLVNNLTFALPKKTNFKISLHESVTDKNVLPIGPGQEYDILCQHVLYNKTAFERYLPKDVRLVTTVREPFERFLSELFVFPQYRWMIHYVNKTVTNPQTMVKVFLENPAKYQSYDFTVINRMSHDLGIPDSQCNNVTFVKEHIQQMDKDFDLVMLTEHMDESLVLLKRLMCWSTKDILYQWRYKRNIRPPFAKDLIDRHKELAHSEYLIYEHFSAKFKRLLSVQKSDFLQETKLFKRSLRKATEFCRPTSQNRNQTISFPASDFDRGFYLTANDCKLMNLNEIKFVSYLKKVHNNPKTYRPTLNSSIV